MVMTKTDYNLAACSIMHTVQKQSSKFYIKILHNKVINYNTVMYLQVLLL